MQGARPLHTSRVRSARLGLIATGGYDSVLFLKLSEINASFENAQKKCNIKKKSPTVMHSLVIAHNSVSTNHPKYISFYIGNHTIIQKAIAYSIAQIRLNVFHCRKCSLHGRCGYRQNQC
jgi:hypothetical protein